MKKIVGLLLSFIVPVLLLTGCGIDTASMYAYTDEYCDKVNSVTIQNNNDEWIEYTDINKYVLDSRTGLIYIHRNNGDVIITHVENVIIYCK